MQWVFSNDFASPAGTAAVSLYRFGIEVVADSLSADGPG
jgi:hypothetical protein